MKRALLAAVALAAVLVGSSPSPAAAEADVRLETGSDEINFVTKVCDENIHFTGTVRFSYMTVSSGTDTFLSKVRIVDVSLVGVGETTGTTYRLVRVLSEMGMGTDDGAVGGNYELTVKIIGGGQIVVGQKWVGRWTRTPNGDITVSFEEVKQDWVCAA
jgi:hypothetical protein